MCIYMELSGEHGAFSLSTNMLVQKLNLKNFLLRKTYESFDTGIVKKFRKFSTEPKNL